MFGLSRHLIDAGRYSTLVVVVIASAVVPTPIAQKWFRPRHELSQETANEV